MEICSNDLTFIGKDDYGLTFYITCPNCKDIIVYSEHMNNLNKCECGYEWKLKISAIGYKGEEK